MAKNLNEQQRKILVDALVNDYLDSMDNDSGYAEYVVRQGFFGIEHRSDDDLIADCRSAGLEHAIDEAGLLLSRFVVSYIDGKDRNDVLFVDFQAEDLDHAVEQFDSWASSFEGGMEMLYGMPGWVYDLQPGSQVVWRDPDAGKSSGIYSVVGINTDSGRVENRDTVIRLKNDAGSEAEALPRELYKPLDETQESVGVAATKFVVRVADLRKWGQLDPNSEIGEPGDGAWDSHTTLMDLIDEARELIGVTKADPPPAQTAPMPTLAKDAG